MVNERDDEKEVQEEAAPPKKRSTILIIVAALVLLVLVGGGAAAGYFFLLAPKDKHAGGEGGKKAEAHAQASGESQESGPMKSLDPFVVNLTDSDGTRYLKLVMQVELSSEELAPEFEKKMPQIRDEIIMLLSSKSFDDLSTSPGKRSLKRSVIESVNRNLSTGKVVNVFFSDFVVQ